MEIPGNLQDTAPIWATDTLKAIDTTLPHVFHEQARQVAQFIDQLDTNSREAIQNPKIAKFVSHLGQTGYIKGAQLWPDTFSWIPDRSHTLPSWLKKNFLVENDLAQFQFLDSDDRKRAKNLYDGYVRQNDLAYENVVGGGFYYAIGTRDRNIPYPRGFKMYVEEQAMLQVLENNLLDSLLSTLIQKNVSPHEMKLFEREKLVFYFSQDITKGHEVQEIFSGIGIQARGPAQDVFRIINDERGLGIYAYCSNDTALGKLNGDSYKYERYIPQDFLQGYLTLVQNAGKSPISPYETSFVYFHSSEPPDQNKLKAAEKFSGYPIVYSNTPTL